MKTSEIRSQLDLIDRCFVQFGPDRLPIGDVYVESFKRAEELVIETATDGTALELRLSLDDLEDALDRKGDAPHKVCCTLLFPQSDDPEVVMNIPVAPSQRPDTAEAPILLVGHPCGGRYAGIDIRLGVHPMLTVAGTSVVHVEGKDLYLKGRIGAKTYRQITRALEQHPEIRRLIITQSDGSVHDRVNLEIGKIVRASRLATHVAEGADIVSGAVDLFLAGTTRTIAPGAKLGVHAWSDGQGCSATDFDRSDPRHAGQLDYVIQMLGPETGPAFYWFTLGAAPVDGMYYLSPDEIAKFGLVTDR